MPGAIRTYINGIDGSNLVGYYQDAQSPYHYHGFLYNGTNWTTLDFPGATATYISGIDGGNLVGMYQNGSGSHGFIYTIPEPATLLLLGFGLAIAAKRR